MFLMPRWVLRPARARRLWQLGWLWALAVSPTCSHRLIDASIDPDLIAEDALTFASLQGLPVGDRVRCSLLSRHAPDPCCWRSMGFAPDDGWLSHKAVQLSEAVGLVPLGEGLMATIGTVAITSIDRQDIGRPVYLYATLRRLLQVLPPGAQVNVLVGDDRADYAAPARLAEQLGIEAAARVHVHPASAEQAAFLAEHFSLHARGAWNYARALLSHRGRQDLLLLEDDVHLAADAVGRVDRLWPTSGLTMASIYNADCGKLPSGPLPAPGIDAILEPDFTHEGFMRTQAMIFRHDLTAALGRFLHLRAQCRAYDMMIDAFTRAHGIQMGSFYPSLAQHTGIISTGLMGHAHQSACFADDMDGWAPPSAVGRDAAGLMAPAGPEEAGVQGDA